MGTMENIIRRIRSLNHLSAWAASFFLVAMMLLSVGDVIGRYLHYPIPGTYELVGFLLLFTTGFALAYTQQVRDHIAIDVLVSKFPKRVQAVIDTLNICFSVGIIALMMWQSIVNGNKLWVANEGSMTLRIPIAFFLWAAAFFCGLMVLQLLTELPETIRKIKKR